MLLCVIINTPRYRAAGWVEAIVFLTRDLYERVAICIYSYTHLLQLICRTYGWVVAVVFLTMDLVHHTLVDVLWDREVVKHCWVSCNTKNRRG